MLQIYEEIQSRKLLYILYMNFFQPCQSHIKDKLLRSSRQQSMFSYLHTERRHSQRGKNKSANKYQKIVQIKAG
jgi:hypothetical protein